MKLNKENIKLGMTIYKEEKKFIILKVNKNFFYYQEYKTNPKVLLDNFENKPKKYKIEDYCNDNKVFKGLFSETFEFNEKEEAVISQKINKTKSKVSECCAKTAITRLKKKNKSGKSYCKKCNKDLNVIKIEDDKWLTFSQEMNYYKVNIESYEILPFEPRKLLCKKEN